MRTFTQQAGVYALVDPRTERVMYVGQSVDIEYRYRQHCNPVSCDNNMAKYRWVQELATEGHAPRLVVLEECDWPESDEAERRFIRQFKGSGQCELNIALGGAGPVVSRLHNGHPDDWFQLGLKIKRARALLMEIVGDVLRLAGAREGDKARKALDQLDRFKWGLEGLLSRIHPEWKGISRMFGGPEGEDVEI